MALRLLNHSAFADAPINVPTLHGPYTLSFSAAFQRLPPLLTDNVKAGNLNVPGRITVSSNGSTLLYIMAFGSWRNIVIYDSKKSLAYEYNSSGRNAQVMPGADQAYAIMHYIPFPAVGLDEFPLLQSVSCGQKAAGCFGTLAYLGATMAGAGSSVSNEPAYDPDSPVVIKQWNGTPVVTECEIYVRPRPSLPNGRVPQRWQFSRFRVFKGVPVAQTIDYTEKPHRRQGHTLVYLPDCKATYTLVAASEKPLSPDSYRLESYLKSSNSVDDHQDGKDTTFSFDPKGGSLEEQRAAALRGVATDQADKDNGTGSDRTRTGVFTALALLCGGLMWAMWRRPWSKR